jgi:hypothetical protein
MKVTKEAKWSPQELMVAARVYCEVRKYQHRESEAVSVTVRGGSQATFL